MLLMEDSRKLPAPGCSSNPVMTDQLNVITDGRGFFRHYFLSGLTTYKFRVYSALTLHTHRINTRKCVRDINYTLQCVHTQLTRTITNPNRKRSEYIVRSHPRSEFDSMLGRWRPTSQTLAHHRPSVGQTFQGRDATQKSRVYLA